ncbi:winged helix-turn-helix transcriptional regulator [Aliiroseovarius sp.]|uniref:winged helix-turn-helix transcriptional regulator n=1 Tax=Aliiroseovarius sp. TaxID=1872442 RepID=UPI003BADB39D
MDIPLLVKITSRAWCLSILAALYRGTPARQAPLLAATGASRTAFAQSLAHLIDLGVLERNPGHGHPLRPEYRLTATGKEAAAMAARIMEAKVNDAGLALLRRSWTVPVLATCQQPRFFGEVKTALPPITDRALSQSLKQLQARDWITRAVDTDIHPPRALYQAMGSGADIADAATALLH